MSPLASWLVVGGIFLVAFCFAVGVALWAGKDTFDDRPGDDR